LRIPISFAPSPSAAIDEPTPVQIAVLRPELAASDELVSAQTGSGKTVAYGLALASTLLGEADTLRAAPASRWR
jgi:ATP-dependent RNA helicase DeaD